MKNIYNLVNNVRGFVLSISKSLLIILYLNSLHNLSIPIKHQFGELLSQSFNNTCINSLLLSNIALSFAIYLNVLYSLVLIENTFLGQHT